MTFSSKLCYPSVTVSVCHEERTLRALKESKLEWRKGPLSVERRQISKVGFILFKFVHAHVHLTVGNHSHKIQNNRLYCRTSICLNYAHKTTYCLVLKVLDPKLFYFYFNIAVLQKKLTRTIRIAVG